MKEAFGTMARGVAQRKEDYATMAAQSIASDVALSARLAAEEALIDATHDERMAAEQALRDDPIAGSLETAGNILSGLKGLFGKRK